MTWKLLNNQSICVFSFPCSAYPKKTVPNTSTDCKLPSANKNQEKSFHVVRNLMLILSFVKNKALPQSIFLPCGKRSQYTTKNKSIHPNPYHQISWGLRFYLPSKGEGTSKMPNKKAVLVLLWQVTMNSDAIPDSWNSLHEWALGPKLLCYWLELELGSQPSSFLPSHFLLLLTHNPTPIGQIRNLSSPQTSGILCVNSFWALCEMLERTVRGVIRITVGNFYYFLSQNNLLKF